MIWDYYRFLKDENEIGGFFSKSDTERIFERHLYESLIFASAACEEYYVATGHRVSRETSILDAGSGPGLPGFLFAARTDMPRVTFLDSSQRRLKRVADYAAEHFPEDHSTRFKFQYRRAEEYTANYPLIVSRALIPFPAIVELLGHLQKPGDVMILWSPKDALPDEKVNIYLDKLGYVSRETVAIPELSFLGTRQIIVLKKMRSSQKGYPRKWKDIKDSIPDWKPIRKPST
ncbi:MAG: class I SAM-dependent methyltransferase [bacterium]|nr:class I SAM-dependent methyltransferase [bacterium]